MHSLSLLRAMGDYQTIGLTIYGAVLCLIDVLIGSSLVLVWLFRSLLHGTQRWDSVVPCCVGRLRREQQVKTSQICQPATRLSHEERSATVATVSMTSDFHKKEPS